MTPPRTLIVCKSVHHRNTAKVAQVIADVLQAAVCEPENLDVAAINSYDLIGFGSGIYFGQFHADLRQAVKQLPDVSPANHPAFVFSTAGLPCLSRLWHWPLKTQLSKKGFQIIGEFCCRGFDTVGPLRLIGGLNRQHPDARDLERAATFAGQLLVKSSAAIPTHPVCSSL